MSTKVYIPRDSAAVSVGANDVARAIAEEAAKRELDIEIIRTGSRGMFWLEPLIEVATTDGRVGFGPVLVDDVTSLFDADFLTNDSHDLGIGTVDDHPYLARQQRLTFARVGVINPLSLTDYRAHGGLVGLQAAAKMAPAEIVTAIMDSGLRGRGGAGFPAGIKWKTVLDQVADQKYICCNADEGDSGTFADRMIMEGDPGVLIEGMIIAGMATGATQGYIYIRSEYPDAIATFNAAIALWEDKGLLGDDILGSGRAFNLAVRRGAGAYICGEESSMLNSIEGKRGIVRSRPPIPAIEGLFGKPTIVNNVLTLATVPSILANGPDWYANYGEGRSKGTQPFQLAGNIKHGGLVELAFGVSLQTLIEEFGGGTLSGKPARAAQLGGPLGAYVPTTGFDVAMTYESLAKADAMLGHGGIVLFDNTVDMAAQARFAMEFCALESCGKCTPCRIGAVRGVEVIDRITAGKKRAENIVVLEDLCEVMEGGSLCAMGGLTPLPVRSALRHFPEDFDKPVTAE